ncbi:MAG: adenosylmethionine--8-amino-7-oxononanoate transaminase [Mariniblastus sp.]|jgi:adenosylmethionine-8-amino-7-oxononanoate aminotransferase|nr:adenosylmethionine--8-amino-7-oxononanoate transaminase [Mariniblastus sp.]
MNQIDNPKITEKNKDLMRRDLAVLWHPCTQMKDHESYPLIPIKNGKGVWLHDFDGNRYIDAISSWWVNIFGHANPTINAALSEQANQLEHVIFAGFSHEPGIRLAERLVAMTPNGLDRVFYGDNGSSAIEIALKMSFHYWKNKGRPEKTEFVNLANSYHGETFGALAVGDVALYKETYEPLLMTCRTVESPDCFHREEQESWEEHTLRKFDSMRREIEQNHQTIAAVVIEPLIQCAGNMRMYHAVYLRQLRKLCDEFDVHLIADEIAVGFGRTGTMFGCEQAEISPDFLCVGKGLTAGYLPLSAVLTTQNVYDAFYDDYETLRAFLHSHSYTGNPLACGVALATLDLFDSENTIEENQATAKAMGEAFAHLNDHPHVAEVRQTGMVLAAEMVSDKKNRVPYPWQQRRGLKVYQHGLKNECLLRPIGNVVYLMPPYVINHEQINHLAKIATEGIQLATR